MSDAGGCELCGRPTPGRDCTRCGTTVCRMHFDSQLRLCIECAERRTPDDRRGDTSHL